MSETVVKHFEIAKNFAFKINTQEEENELNQLFGSLNIDPSLSKKDQFFQFVEIFKKNPVNDSVNQLTEKLIELTEENESLKSDKIELTEEKSSLKTQLSLVKPQLTELTEQNEDLKRQLETEKVNHTTTLEKPVNLDLKANELLIDLPPFQHHLLAKVASSSAMKRFDERKPDNSGLYIKFKNTEDKKEIMSTTLVNFFIGIILNYHKHQGHLPDIHRVATERDIDDSITYAKSK